jgi:hypothetical protein
MLIADFVHIPVVLSLLVIVAILGISVIASWSKYKDTKIQNACPDQCGIVEEEKKKE